MPLRYHDVFIPRSLWEDPAFKKLTPLDQCVLFRLYGYADTDYRGHFPNKRLSNAHLTYEDMDASLMELIHVGLVELVESYEKFTDGRLKCGYDLGYSKKTSPRRAGFVWRLVHRSDDIGS
jgi:hypothetical protein